MTSLGNWSFTAFPPFPATIIPNYAFWNATNEAKNLTYQIGVSWPFEWGESRDVANKTALTMYVTDGNAYGLTAAESFKRRKGVDPQQSDSVVVTIGYPISSGVYDMTRRFIDLRPPLDGPEGDGPSGADDFLAFINGTLRPWVRDTVFPSVTFTRDALYGHSFGGIFTIYALIAHPEMFDTYLAATPTMIWNNKTLLDEVSRRWPSGGGAALETVPALACENSTALEKPAVFITYGGAEQFPQRRRTETEAEFQERKALWNSFKQTEVTEELFYRIQGSRRVRDVTLKAYAGQDHAGVASSTIADGIGYFVDW